MMNNRIPRRNALQSLGRSRITVSYRARVSKVPYTKTTHHFTSGAFLYIPVFSAHTTTIAKIGAKK